MKERPDLDPITVEVVDNRLDEIVREMQHVLFRTGYSTIIRDSKDASAGICLPDGRVVGQAFRLPLHCGVFPPTVDGIWRAFEPDDLEPGDAVAVNDPYWCGANHTSDMLVATPTFVDDELVAFCLTIAHKPDIGGLVPGTTSPDATELYHEGLLLPPVKYRRAGAVDPAVEAIVRNNSRTPTVSLGDIEGQLGCTAVGAASLVDLVETYGLEAFRGATETLLASTRDRLAEAIEPWDGETTVEGTLDTGRELLAVRLTASSRAGEGTVRFDFAGTDAQTRGPYNLRPHVARSACLYSLVGVVDPTLDLNSGVEAACAFDLPEGSLVNPTRPAACNNYSQGMAVCVHLALRALAAFRPEGAVAETGGKMSISVGGRAADGDDEAVVHYEIMGSGYGGHAGGDGASCMASSYESNVEFADVEIVETEFDERFVRFATRPDSAGAGAFRGGVGFVREYEARAPLSFTYRGSGHRVEPRGVGGGLSPGHARAVYAPADGAARDLATSETVALSPGDRVRIERVGGAGFGEPRERDPERVLADVLDGFVTPEAARETYGVELTPHGTGYVVDEAATRERRRGAE